MADLVRRLSVRSLVPPGGTSAPQAVVENTDPANLRDYEGVLRGADFGYPRDAVGAGGTVIET